jgi:MerR family transcriptional regulator, light-induced transcriptional regulator
MKMRKPSSPPTPKPTDTGDASFHRSGAVAQMLRMPVATLRVWERRYGVTQPERSPSGRRLYSADDVRRLALLKQLTDIGHAIGSLASLDMAQLQHVASTHAHALVATEKGERAAADRVSPVRAWRLAVVGTALGSRLQRPALLRRLCRPVVLLGPFDTAAQAAVALQGQQVDALLIHEPQLHAGWLAALDAAAPAFAGVPKAVLYGFAADAVCEALATAGTTLLREPQPDAVVAQWLRSLAQAAPAPQPALGASAAADTAPPRRWDDAALADFAGRSSTIACECPRHVAELLVQLSHFEAYSAECEQRSAADAELHAYLRRVAATSRARFEAALEHVALHEGLILPSPPKLGDAAAAANARRPKALPAP